MAPRRSRDTKKSKEGFDANEIFRVLAELEKERGISKQYMLERINQALVNAYKHDHPDANDVVVYADEEKHTLNMYVRKTVVDEVEEPGSEISRADARQIAGFIGVGEKVNIPVDHVEFGRIAAGNGKQIIIQGLKEAEREMVYSRFSGKEHEILTGAVTRIDPRTGNISLHIGTGADATDALLSRSEQIPGEALHEGDRVKVYMVEVRRGTRGVQVMVSRTHPGLVKRLFEVEVPEIYDGLVEVRSVAREAGSRTKISVSSSDPNIDPIGACVGPKGQRVAAVVDALNGEKIDIIKYSDDPAEHIAAALAPSDVLSVKMTPDEKGCRVVVPDDQLSLAIGKEGQNARLAARLTGCKIDIKPASFQEAAPEPDTEEHATDVVQSTISSDSTEEALEQEGQRDFEAQCDMEVFYDLGDDEDEDDLLVQCVRDNSEDDDFDDDLDELELFDASDGLDESGELDVPDGSDELSGAVEEPDPAEALDAEEDKGIYGW